METNVVLSVELRVEFVCRARVVVGVELYGKLIAEFGCWTQYLSYDVVLRVECRCCSRTVSSIEYSVALSVALLVELVSKSASSSE